MSGELALLFQHIWTGKGTMDLSNPMKNNFIIIINIGCECYTCNSVEILAGTEETYYNLHAI